MGIPSIKPMCKLREPPLIIIQKSPLIKTNCLLTEHQTLSSLAASQGMDKSSSVADTLLLEGEGGETSAIKTTLKQAINLNAMIQ